MFVIGFNICMSKLNLKLVNIMPYEALCYFISKKPSISFCVFGVFKNHTVQIDMSSEVYMLVSDHLLTLS